MTTIKCTSRMSKGMELNGETLSGDTYAAREYIKEYWDGKWDSGRKVWVVNQEKVVSTIQEQKWGFVKNLSIVETTVTPTATAKTHGVNGWCNKCQSYCYGDCSSR